MAQPVAFPVLLPSLAHSLFDFFFPPSVLSLLLKSLCTLIHKPCLCHVIQHFKYTAHFLLATECPKEGKTGPRELRFQLAEPPQATHPPLLSHSLSFFTYSVSQRSFVGF